MAQIRTEALPVSMAAFKRLVAETSPDLALNVRGRHAVGKSEGVYQAAAMRRSDVYRDENVCKQLVERFGGVIRHADGEKTSWSYEDGIPVLERRLSQMTEGDTIGLPFDSKHGTVFKACDWLITSCDFPVLLFLDERNRALDGVKQSVFQLCDSKAFYGNRCHKETKVIIAENVGDEYQVQACDPAEVSRTAVVTLDPDEKEWLDYAKDKCDQATIEYIRSNANKLEHRAVFEPNKKYPDRRSWFKLDQELQRLGLFDSPEDIMFYTLACSMIGMEVGSHFTAFCKDRERQVSAADILKDWAKAKSRLVRKASVSNEMYIECAAKLSDHLSKHHMGEEQAYQLGLFMHDCPSEIFLTVWSGLNHQRENIMAIHPYVQDRLVAVAQGLNNSTLTCPSIEKVRAERKNPLVEKKLGGSAKRGAKSKKA